MKKKKSRLAHYTPEQAIAFIEAQAAELERLAPAVVEILERELFSSAPPRFVDFLTICAWLDVRFAHLGGEPSSDAERETMAEIDELVIEPDDGRASSTLDLILAVVASLRRAAIHLQGEEPARAKHLAPGFVGQAQIFVGAILMAVHGCGHTTPFVRLAAAAGVNPLPFAPDGARRGQA